MKNQLYFKNPIIPLVALIFFHSGIHANAAIPAASREINPKSQQNRKLVKDFYDLAFNRHHSKEAADQFLQEGYIQHNPHVASGKQAFIKAFANESAHDKSRADFVRIIAEGDLVVLHSHKISNSREKDRVGIDIFRIENGKIAEHWDVNQDITTVTASGNTVY
ncbi:MAG: nuclear transport factor 2 family protein [Bdellovibrionales bacterium]|nr:nuclear transport factor 2 family protein [Oligoflexia bacterium]